MYECASFVGLNVISVAGVHVAVMVGVAVVMTVVAVWL